MLVRYGEVYAEYRRLTPMFNTRPAPGVPWPGPSHLGRINLLQPRRPPHGLNHPAACNRRAGPCGVLPGSHADDASPPK